MATATGSAPRGAGKKKLSGSRHQAASRPVRNEILESALRVFARDGFDGATMPAIARGAKTGHPLIHYHFGSKENLWRAAVDYAFSDMRQSLVSLEAAGRDLAAVDRLRMMARAFVQFTARHPEHAAILFGEARADKARFDWLAENYLRPMHDVIDGIVAEAARKKQIKRVPPVHLASLLIGGTILFFLAEPMTRGLYGLDAGDPEVADAHADWLVEIIFRGIEVKTA